MENKGLMATVFAAGLAAGGGGAEALRDPDPTSFLAAGITEAVTAPCETVSRPAECADLRRWQLGVLIDDLDDDVKPGDAIKLGGIELYVAERMDYGDDLVKELWVNDALSIINRRLADGYAAQDISPDDTIMADALIAMLEAARDA